MFWKWGNCYLANQQAVVSQENESTWQMDFSCVLLEKLCCSDSKLCPSYVSNYFLPAGSKVQMSAHV